MKPPLCRTCGKPIPKQTRSLWFGEYTPRRYDIATHFTEKPTSRADLTKFTNGRIIHVTWSGRGESRFIRRASEWDGQSYISRYFCKDACARTMGYFALDNPGYETKAYADARAAQRGART